MKTVLRWLAVAICVVALIAVAFNIYGNLLLDYSLDSLENALSVTDVEADESNPLEQNVYRSFVQGLALDELAKENPNLQEIVVLDIASRSLGEAADRSGNQRAEIYLKEIQENKVQERGVVLRFFDKAYYFALSLYQSFVNAVHYLGNRLTGTSKSGGDDKEIEYSSIFILNQASLKEKSGLFDEAEELYLKFLEFYPKSDRHGFVALSLGNIYLRQNKLEKAKSILSPIRSEYLGSEEAEMAANMLDRINLVEDRLSYIERLKGLIPSKAGTFESESLRLKLAVAQFSVYRFEEAEENLKSLQDASSNEIKSKVSFYLGWLYKIQGSLDESKAVLLGLVESPELEEDLRLSLHAQLADVYYLMKDSEKAIKHLEIVTGGTNKALKRLEATERVWQAVAELETANIYFYDYKDADGANSSLTDFRQASIFGFNDFGFAGSGENKPLSLRDAAFRALSQGRIEVANDLLNRNLTYFPRDPWTHSALASLFLLYGEFEKAQDYALKAYRWYQDEYTTAVLAYVYSYMEKYEEAISLYQSSLEKDPTYLPALFNLACMYLEIGDYNEAIKMLTELNEKLSYRENYMKSKVLNNMGYALWWLGVKEDAKIYFQRAIDKTPGFTLARKNLQLIQQQDSPEMVTFKG